MWLRSMLQLCSLYWCSMLCSAPQINSYSHLVHKIKMEERSHNGGEVSIAVSVADPVENPAVNSPVKAEPLTRSPSKLSKLTENWNSPSRKQTFPSKFQLTSELQNGSIAFAPDEQVLASWTFESTSLSLAEYFATFGSFGLYYVITRKLLKRMRKYSVHVTNLHIIVKEEMIETSWGCLKILLENQASFPVSTLSYVFAEVVGEKMLGLLPSSVTLEMRFGRYPVDSEVPITKYRSLLAILFEPFALATKAAYKNVFGVDFDASPVTLSLQLVKAIPLMAVPHMWLLFAGAFGMDLVKQMAYGIYMMMIAALLDPSVGPRQAIGAKDASVFHLAADVSEDPECRANMRNILDTITSLLPDRNIIDPSQRPRLLAPLTYVSPGDAPRTINSAKRYGTEQNFVVLQDYLSIPTDEVVYDACPVNPHWTVSDVQKVICSFGAYYITDIAGHIQHRKNLIFTDRRIIQHSVLVSSYGGACDHSRLDFWVNDDFVNMSAVDFKKNASFRATAKNKGWLSFEMGKTNSYTMYVFRNLFKPLYAAPKSTPGLTSVTKEQWFQTNQHKGAALTTIALQSNNSEKIDVSISADQELYSYFYNMFCCPRPPEITLTATDEALYIEDFRSATCFRSATRVFVVLPWNDVDGVYWQNFSAAGPDCATACLLSCVCPGVFGCSGCCCCCLQPNGAVENNSNFFDVVFGYKGSTVAVCARGSNTFRLGMLIPHTYYGVCDNSTVNALVDTINFRSLLNDPKNQCIDSESSKSAGGTVQVNSGGAGAALTALGGGIAGASMKMQNMVRLGSSKNNSPTRDAGQPNSPGAASLPHPTYYEGNSCRQTSALHGFPLNFNMDNGYVSLAAGETLVKGWKVETTHLEDWEIILMFLSFGLSFLYRLLFVQHRRFYNIYVTTDRVLIKEEVFEMRFWTVSRVFENQASFKLSDLCYVSTQEVGSRWCGFIPAMSQISMRFGRYPKLSEAAHSLDASMTTTSDRNPISVALMKAMKYAYNVHENGTPQAVMDNFLRVEQNPRSFIKTIADMVVFSVTFVQSLAEYAADHIKDMCIWMLSSSMGTVGPAQVDGTRDSRSFHILFKTAAASAVTGDVMKTLLQAASAKHDPLVPGSGLAPLDPARYGVLPAGSICPVNSTGEYGQNGSMVVLERMWSLLAGEVVYDAVPTNPRWTLWERIMSVLTLSIYYWLYVRKRLQYKTSHMVTNRRVISHTLRVTHNVRHSFVEMWLLAPTTSFTLIKKVPSFSHVLCRGRTSFSFVTDSTRFGVLQVHVECEPFILSLLKVLTPAQPAHLHSNSLLPMSREEFLAIPEIELPSYTVRFLGENEVIDAALGSTMPLTCLKTMLCKSPMKFTITFTCNGILVEAYDQKVRYFTSLSYEIVTGTYWSNFQSHSDVCEWHNGPNYITPLHGYSGSQVRLCVRGGRSFGIGIILPNRFYNALQSDASLDAFVTTLSQKLRLFKGGQVHYQTSPMVSNGSGKFGAENA